jgi:hypothetical protein
LKVAAALLMITGCILAAEMAGFQLPFGIQIAEAAQYARPDSDVSVEYDDQKGWFTTGGGSSNYYQWIRKKD